MSKFIVIKIMMKKIVLFLSLVLSLSKMMAQQRELVDKVVAKVGDEYVLLSEVEEQFSYAKDQHKDLPENYRCLVLDQILVTKLLVAQAKIDSLYPKDDELEQQLTARFDKILDIWVTMSNNSLTITVKHRVL